MFKFNSKFIKCLCLLLFLQSCAYFNTFYNAENIYKRAEELRNSSEQNDDMLYINEYQRALEKAEKLLQLYPDSRFALDAKFMKAKSLYYLSEYEQSKIIFSEIISESEIVFHDESIYWLSLIKWKNSQPVIAIEDLNKLFGSTLDKSLKSRIALSLGEIYSSLDNHSLSYTYLIEGINLTNNRLLKEKIYFSIANSAYNRNDYEIAIKNYQDFLGLSSKKSLIHEANLKIVEIFRKNKKFDDASNKVKELLLDENFDDISANLELELVKIEIDRNKISFAIDNLDRISQEYRDTLVAAEANFLLSNIYLTQKYQDFEKAKFFLNEIIAQDKDSKFKDYAERNKYDIIKLIKYNNEINEKINIDRNLYRSGEILSFKLGKKNEGRYFFDKIINNHSQGDYFLRSLFSMYLIDNNNLNKEKYKSIILNDFSNSDFAKYIIDKENLKVNHYSSELLEQAEVAMQKEYSKSVPLYKKVLSLDKSNESSKVAAYFLGRYYDYEASDIDSAKYYYNLVINTHPFSDQSKKALQRLEVINGE